MPIGFPRRSLTFRKPPAGTPLLANHPLATLLSGAYPLNEGGGGIFRNRGVGRAASPAAGGSTTLVSGAAGFEGGRPCDRGVGVRFDGTGYLTAANPTQAYVSSTGLTPGWSLAVKFRINVVAAGGVVSLGNSAQELGPAYLLQCNGTTNLRALLGDVAYQVLIAPPVAGTWYTVVSTFTPLMRDAVAGTEGHYLGIGGGSSARQVYSGALTTATVGAGWAGNNLYLANGFGGVLACDVEFLYLWDRELKYAEALNLIRDPYQMWDYSASVGVKPPAAAPTFVATEPLIVRQAVPRASFY